MVPRESPIVPQKKFDLHDQYQANIVYSMMKIGILYNTVMMVIYSRGLLRPCIAYSSLYILSRKSLDKPSRPVNEIGSTWPYQQVNLQVYNHKNKHICNIGYWGEFRTQNMKGKWHYFCLQSSNLLISVTS